MQLIAMLLKKVIGTNKQQLNEFSQVNHADKIKINVILIHGEVLAVSLRQHSVT
ncbi:MAG: dipeptidyl aminopeptidase/acylaminoacyl peptidase [Paraglaciecola sp.]|jgi:dipeptidyl aminopeptidase/acylaminoacyl peptidase